MPLLYILPSSRHQSIDQFPERVNTGKPHVAQFLSRLKGTVNNGFGQSNGPENPLKGWEIGGVVLACLIGAVILALILHYCWKCGGPRPTYYERAMKLDKKYALYQARKMGRDPQYPSRRIAESRRVNPIVIADRPVEAPLSSEPARPDAARTRSSSCYDGE
ncbi:hypothetical protein F5X98DRAFT_357830 [Xylaria grammica]|nr:hypothetical protein F5X98DRAFT_357830 [Xylaria grammica]